MVPRDLDVDASEYGPAIEPKKPPKPRPMEPGDLGLSEYESYAHGGPVLPRSVGAFKDHTTLFKRGRK